MVEKPVYCTHCRNIFEYDTDTAEAGRFRYILVCPKCGKQNKVLREEYKIMIESAGVLLGAFLGLYFLLHGSFYISVLSALIVGLFIGLTLYYFRVHRLKRDINNGS